MKARRAVPIALATLAALAALLLWIVRRDGHDAPAPSGNAENPLITPLGVTMLSAHRAGGGIAPENTMAALKACAESADFTPDIIEFDLHLTADDALVLLHDATLDRTSDAAEVFGERDVDAGEKTLAELKRLNMGARFTAPDGTAPYAYLRGDALPPDLRIVTLGEALGYLEGAGRFWYIIEIKNEGARGREAADNLHAELVRTGCINRAIVGTFHNEVTAYMDAAYPDMMRSAGVRECLRFYICALLGLRVDGDAFGFQALQIPTTDYIVNLGTARVVNYAHAHNIAVQYWTINDTAEMARLQSIGADAVMTDIPDAAAAVLTQPAPRS